MKKRYEAETGEKVVVVAGSRADVVKQIGNAVCPKMAEALVGGA